MKISVLNGSPKGEQSVTMQYIAFLEKRFPGHRFEYIHASLYCKKMETDDKYFSGIMSGIKDSDVVIWAFPLYYLLVHSQYKRFIELIFERGQEHVFRGKYTAALSTSIHFFDNTAHNYIRAICDDLGMNYIDFYPAKMNDLTKKQNHASLLGFFSRIERHVSASAVSGRAYSPVSLSDYNFTPGREYNGKKSNGNKVTIVADMEESIPGVKNMAYYFASHFKKAEVVNIRGIKTGPCLGCLKCGFDNICSYDGKDEFIPVLNNVILKSDIIVFVLGMHDRYFSHVWQRYLERNFVNTHQPLLEGKQIAFLVSGPLSQNHNAREILQGYTEGMKGSLAGIVTDESGVADTICGEIDALADTMSILAAEGITRPATFLGVAGTKLFRDEIYGGLRFVFQGDHRYYKKHGIYDFPGNRKIYNLGMSLITLITRIPFLRKRIREELKEGMLRPYRSVLS